MKANELMIGDYARVNRDRLCIKKGSIVVIRGIDADDKLEVKGLVGVAHCHPLDKEQFDGGIWCEYLEPIPLTAEILEKNGFIKDANKDDKLTDTYHLLVPTGFERKSFTIQVNLYKEPICGVSTLIKCWGWLLPHNGGLNDIHLCSANYVHELQHALRLCGIEKEIEL